jgi:hypothetical protein
MLGPPYPQVNVRRRDKLIEPIHKGTASHARGARHHGTVDMKGADREPQHLRVLRRHLTNYRRFMKRFFLVAISLIVVAAILAPAAPNPTSAKVPAFPRTLANARYVYVASYDGDQFDPKLLPEDRDAIGAVQDAIQHWGKLTIVYQPAEADIIILVTSRPSEDLLAVYDAHLEPRGNFLWRVMGRDGLQSGETPLVTQFEKEFESVQTHK